MSHVEKKSSRQDQQRNHESHNKQKKSPVTSVSQPDQHSQSNAGFGQEYTQNDQNGSCSSYENRHGAQNSNGDQHGTRNSVPVLSRQDEQGHPALVLALNRNRHAHYDLCKEAVDYLASRTHRRPIIGIICGTGIGKNEPLNSWRHWKKLIEETVKRHFKSKNICIKIMIFSKFKTKE